MRFHDPADEATLRQTLAEVRGKRGFERGTRWREWTARTDGLVGWICQFVVSLVLLAVLLGAAQEAFATPGWRQLMVGSWFMVEILFINARLSLDGHPGALTLLLLPVRGEVIARWVRGRVLLSTWTTLVRALVAAWVLHDATLYDWKASMVVSHAMSLWLVTIATASIAMHPVVMRLGITRWWRMLSIGLLVTGLVAFMIRDMEAEWVHPERWLEPLAPWLAWFFPAAWLGSATLALPWAVATLVWVLGGVALWITWPRKAGSELDQPQDLMGGPSYADDEDEDGAGALLDPLASPEESPRSSTTGLLLEEEQHLVSHPFDPAHLGWIERLVLLFLGPRERHLAPLLLPPKPGWSAKWRKALWVGLSSILLAVLARWSLPENAFEAARIWLCIIPGLMLVMYVVPLSNSFHHAWDQLPSGGQVLPACMLIPVTMRDLLRLSHRVTWARLLVSLPLVALLAVGMALAIGAPTSAAVTAAKVSVVALIVVAVQRPLLVAYRLDQQMQWVWWRRLSLLMLMIPLWIASIVCAFATIVITATSKSFPGTDTLLLAGGTCLASALLNLLIFALYRYCLRDGYADFLRHA